MGSTVRALPFTACVSARQLISVGAATVFAYGQTGSGKTHTMMGNHDEPGIITRSLSTIFEHIRADNTRQYLLRLSVLEIYNEQAPDYSTYDPHSG